MFGRVGPLMTAKVGVSHPHTPVGYFQQDDGKGRQTHRSEPNRDSPLRADRWVITLHGHRLPSLYRKTRPKVLGLIAGNQSALAPSFCLKYPAGGAGDAKSPARALDTYATEGI